MRSIIVGATVTGFLSLVGTSALSMDRKAYDICTSGFMDDVPIERIVAACTKLLRDPSLSNRKRDEILHARGTAYIHADMNDRAESDFTAGLSLNPNSQFHYEGRAEARLEMGNYEGAIADATQAIGIQPNSEMAYYWRAKAYYAEKKYDQAISDLSAAISFEPPLGSNFADMLSLRAAIFEKFGNQSAAITDYRRALEKMDDNREALEGLRRLGATR
jgi:tetratricopeptide (TPR) repeat protein